MSTEVVSPRSIKILGREPSAWVASAGAVIVVLAALGVPFLSAGQAAAISALIVTLVLLATTRPIAPGLVTAVAAAGAALLAAYGMALPDTAVAAVTGATLAVFALVTRQQVEPKETVVTRS